MCCLFTALVLGGPRAAIVVWWLLAPVRWGATFDTFILPFLGFLFFPFTTLMYVLVFPNGIDTFDYIWLGLALLVDILAWGGGGYGNRRQIRGASPWGTPPVP
jgi:hypothetical protein